MTIDPKSIWVLFSSSTYLWSLKVIRHKNCSIYHAYTHASAHSLIQTLTNGRIIVSLPTLLRRDNKKTRQRSSKAQLLYHINTRQRKAWHPLASGRGGGGGQSGPGHLTQWPNLNNLIMKSECEWTKTVSCTVPTTFHMQRQKVDIDLWLGDSKSKSKLSSTTYKFESDCAKTVVCIVSIRFYSQTAKVDPDLWPRDPKPKRFLLSSPTTYI